MAEPYRPEAQPRRGIPTWGWLLIGCGCLALAAIPMIVLLGSAILFPVFSQARLKARQAMCLSNVKQLSTAMLLYAQDYDDQLPRGGRWMDDISPYARGERLFHCETAQAGSPSAYGYAFNSNLSRKKMKQVTTPATTRLLYDSSNLKQNATDPVTSLANPPRHNGGNNIGYVDGHAKWTRFGGTTPRPGGGQSRR